MMTPTEYIKNQLVLWNVEFVGIHIRYAYDVEANFHIVEIDPEAIRRGNAEYKKQELDFWMKFMTEYPEENLLISEPSDINDMSNLIYSNESDKQVISVTVVPCTWILNYGGNLYEPTYPIGRDSKYRYSAPVHVAHNNVYALAA
jgi:hypothetical protein